MWWSNLDTTQMSSCIWTLSSLPPISFSLSWSIFCLFSLGVTIFLATLCSLFPCQTVMLGMFLRLLVTSSLKVASFTINVCSYASHFCPSSQIFLLGQFTYPQHWQKIFFIEQQLKMDLDQKFIVTGFFLKDLINPVILWESLPNVLVP